MNGEMTNEKKRKITMERLEKKEKKEKEKKREKKNRKKREYKIKKYITTYL